MVSMTGRVRSLFTMRIDLGTVLCLSSAAARVSALQRRERTGKKGYTHAAESSGGGPVVMGLHPGFACHWCASRHHCVQ